jgi:hypothetical protein
LGVIAVTLLVVAAIGEVSAARDRASVERIGVAAAVCAAVGAIFATAASITIARTQGET